MDDTGHEYFSLTDRTGRSVDYSVALHGGVEGWRLYQRIAGILAPVAGSGLLAVFASKQGGGLDVDIEALAANEGIGASLRSVVMGFTPSLVDELMRHVVRDGKLMSDPVQRGIAYRANYDEQALALLKVMTINGFFPAANAIEKLVAVGQTKLAAMGDGSASSEKPPNGGELVVCPAGDGRRWPAGPGPVHHRPPVQLPRPGRDAHRTGLPRPTHRAGPRRGQTRRPALKD